MQDRRNQNDKPPLSKKGQRQWTWNDLKCLFEKEASRINAKSQVQKINDRNHETF